MAFTRKFLSALGIEPEKLDEIMSAHIEVVDALKGERDSYKDKAESLDEVQKKLTSAEAKLSKYGDAEMVSKADYDTVSNELATLKADIDNKQKYAAKESALRRMYKAAGISDKYVDTVLKCTSFDDYELTADGTIKEAESHIESAKTEWADFVETVQTSGVNTPNPPETDKSNKDPFEVGFDGE